MELNRPGTGFAGLPEPNAHAAHGSVCYTAGWGYTSEGGQSTRFLHSINATVYSYDECVNSPDTNFNPIDIVEEVEFCAGWTDGTKDACIGDSGGPLICVNDENEPVLYGITSWGIGCASDGFPGVYAKISAIIEWINQTVQSHSSTTAPSVVTSNSSLLLNSSKRYPADLFTVLRLGTVSYCYD